MSRIPVNANKRRKFQPARRGRHCASLTDREIAATGSRFHRP
jgi:hypothetical protein